MPVHRLALYRSDDPFTRIPNSAVNDPRLDLKARGLLVFMLSKPDGWTFTERALAAQLGVSREQIRTARKTLEDAGYVRRTTQMKDGRPVSVTEVFDTPPSAGTESVPAQVAGIPTDGIPDRREPPPISNEREIVTNENTLRGPRPRARDLLFEAVAAVAGQQIGSLTKSERGRLNKAVSDLRAVGATPEQVRSAAAKYRTTYPGAALTATALAAHWSSIAPVPKESDRRCRICGMPEGEHHDQALCDRLREGSRW